MMLLSRIRALHPDIERAGLNGNCHAVAQMLRTIWPSARIMYSPAEGHVYTEIDDKFYDIRGRCMFPPRDLQPMNYRDEQPHRWQPDGFFFARYENGEIVTDE